MAFAKSTFFTFLHEGKKLCFLGMALIMASACTNLSASNLGKNLGFGGAKKSSESSAIEKAQLEEATKAYNAQDYAKAATLYEQISSHAPENFDYKLRLADSLRLAGSPAKARAAYDQIAKDAPDSSNHAIMALEGKGLCYIQEANFNEASKLFTIVLGKDAMRWKTINALGVSLSLAKRYKEAMEYYQLALQVSNNHPAVLNNMGLSYALAGDLKKGTAALEKAAQGKTSDQNRKRIALNLALAYGLAERMKDAEKVSAPYLTKPAIYNNLGYYATLAKNKSLARSYLEKALASSPTHYQKAWDNMQKIN